MSTQPPSTPSESSQQTTDRQAYIQLEELHARLIRYGYTDPADLVVIFLSPNDMVIGMSPVDELDSVSSLWVQRPKRLSRHVLVSRTSGQMGIELRVWDFDLMADSGSVLLVPQGGFRLSRQHITTQINYCAMLVDFLDSKMIAKAQEAGIELPQNAENRVRSVTSILGVKG